MKKMFVLDYFTRFDGVELAEEYLIEYDFPGFSRENLNVSIRDGSLQVFGSRPEVNEGGKIVRLAKEVSYSTKLPKNSKLEAISVALKDGILTIRIPKQEDGCKFRELVIQI